MRQTLSALIILFVVTHSFAVIKTNPLISKFKPIFSSFTGSPAALVNGKFGETAWSVTDSSWIALKIDAGPSRILFTWNTTAAMWSDSIGHVGACAKGVQAPSVYRLLLSANSTNGADGEWAVADSVTGNTVSARSHVIELNGANWIKMMVISGSGKIDEIEAFDVSAGNDDSWFFTGTAVTAQAFKDPVQLSTFRYYLADIVKDLNVKATPAFISGGNGCITSGGLAADIGTILDITQGIKHLAIEIGANDAMGGTADSVAAFTSNLQRIVTACRAKKVEPILARIPAVNQEVTTWQINEAYLKAIDALVKKNKLTPGPDLYTWFLSHPDELMADGIRPTARGGASIQRLWAESVYKLYLESTVK